MLPVITDYAFTGTDGNAYTVEIEIYETQNLTMFPEGVSGTFRLFKLDQDGERKLIYLIDNHAPYGFHEHDELPKRHESRVTIHVKHWREAWDKFQTRCREITK